MANEGCCVKGENCYPRNRLRLQLNELPTDLHFEKYGLNFKIIDQIGVKSACVSLPTRTEYTLLKRSPTIMVVACKRQTPHLELA